MSGAPSAEPEGPLFDRIREAAAEVARRARFVRIDDTALERFAGHLARERPALPDIDPTLRRLGSAERTLAFVVTMNAANFGSGWFPHLRKREGLSGSLSLATALRERFEAEGALAAGELAAIDAAGCARLFGQPLEPPVDELMGLYARSWNDLGRLLLERHRGSFEALVAAAGGSAETLVRLLARMPLYRDVARYEGFAVPFYKRAQITASDLSLVFKGRGPGHFADLDQLTLFADNLVPHVLRMLGVLDYELRLAMRIDAAELLEGGSEEEVEIRAVALHAVERLAASCAARGFRPGVHRLDHLLWSRGQSPHIKARPRHRTRCPYY